MVQKGADLELPYLTMEEDAFAENPFPHFEKARAEHPWLARWQLGYVVTDYQATRDLFAREEKMSTLYNQIVDIMDAHGSPWGEFQKRHILAQGGDTHKRLRNLLAPCFTPRMANSYRPLMREVMSQLLDKWLPKGSFDFEEFASYFPITVMCRLIGADPAVIPELRSAMEAIGLSTSMDRRYLPAMQEGVSTMEEFVERLVAERRATGNQTGSPDMLDLLLDAQAGGEITERELADLLIFLFVGGYDTSKNTLTMVMHKVIESPDIYRRCAEDYDYARAAVEETMRFHSINSTQRLLLDEIVYRDVLLEKGSIIWFVNSLATHDPRYAENPDVFDPEREQRNRHIAFGLGAHICLGQYIARAQIHEGIHQIAQRLKNPRTTGPEGFRPFPGTWGLRGLPMEFDIKEDEEVTA